MHYLDYGHKYFQENAIPEVMQNVLKEFVADHQSDFVTIGGCRETMFFGEYEYRYTGGKHTPRDMPAPLLVRGVLDSLSNRPSSSFKQPL